MTDPASYTITRRHIPEQRVTGKPLGRHVNHDSRSLAYQVPARWLGATSTWYTRQIPILDQGNVGSCTGNASVGAVGTGPLFAALPQIHPALDEPYALKVYGKATELDGYPGTYPGQDTGSDGLSAAKACQQFGLIAGYLHATTLAAMVTALQTTPVIVGVNWYDSWDSPRANGVVAITSGARVRGGHEFEVVGVDVDAKTFRAANSWGTGYGDQGYFTFSWADMDRLLHEQGDCTQLLPLTAAPPTPKPPIPTPTTDPDLKAWWAACAPWARARHVRSNAAAAAAARALAKAKGLE